MPISNNRRMAKNAMMLYFRMLLTMGVTLYTSRVILQTLGVEDYGIYYLVAGFVTLLGFLQGAMASATQRFFSFELGKATHSNISNVFSMSMNIHIVIAIIVLILGETIGFWFLKNKLNIPSQRMLAAEWVYHLSLLSFLVTIVNVPYNALIIAYEKMSIYAWLGIVDVVLKLIIVFMLTWFGLDKLILYAVLSLLVVILIFISYYYFSKRNFPEANYKLYWDKSIFNSIFSYTGWSLWGSIAVIMSSQGVNVLLNIFFGPSVNASRAISMQVSAALKKFVQNIQIAINPQIIKSYASEDLEYMHQLVLYGAKYSYFILLFLSVPVIVNTDIILKVWLGQIPLYSNIFIQIILIKMLIDSISGPLITSAQATGKIKLYQSVVGGILLLEVPIAYLLLKAGASPPVVLVASIITAIMALIARIIILKTLTQIPVANFLKEVILRSIIVSIPVCLIAYLLLIEKSLELGFWLESTLVSIVIIISISVLGISKQEWMFLIRKIKTHPFLMKE